MIGSCTSWPLCAQICEYPKLFLPINLWATCWVWRISVSNVCPVSVVGERFSQDRLGAQEVRKLVRSVAQLICLMSWHLGGGSLAFLGSFGFWILLEVCKRSRSKPLDLVRMVGSHLCRLQLWNNRISLITEVDVSRFELYPVYDKR